MSPSRSDVATNKNLRAALMEKDEKRIQFNLDKEEDKMELQVTARTYNKVYINLDNYRITLIP